MKKYTQEEFDKMEVIDGVIGNGMQFNNKLKMVMKHLNNEKVIVVDPKQECTKMCKNEFCFGGAGIGRATHPWDGLKKCSCGGYPYMVGSDGKDFSSGSPYKIFCIQCLKSTVTDEDVRVIKKEWNENLN